MVEQILCIFRSVDRIEGDVQSVLAVKEAYSYKYSSARSLYSLL